MQTTVFDRVREMFFNSAKALDRHLSIFTRRIRLTSRMPTHSWGRADYAFWRKAYYCQILGFELSGLFIRPIVNKIAAWVLGRMPNFICKNKRSQEALEEWWDKNHSSILRAYREALKQGDCFVVINSDLTVSIIAPDAVDPIVADFDYSRKIGWRIRQVFPHPDNSSRKMIITDSYFADRREQVIEFEDGSTSPVIVYPNLIGIIPVIHIANQPANGEEFGHPEAEALVDLLHRYGQVLEAAIEGNILQGRPTPVIAFETVQNLNAFWRRYGSSTSRSRSDGTVEEYDTLSVDLSELLTISGAEFDYKSPGSFVQDTERLLGLMFYLILEHIELPEFVMGNAIEGSKASAETQMPVFEVFIRMRQRDCLVWMLQVAQVVQSYQALLVPGVSVEEPILQWAKLTQNGRLTKESVEFAYGAELMDERTALMLLPVDVERPDQVLKQAKKDAAKRHKINTERQAELMKATTPPEAEGGDSGNGNGNTREFDSDLKRELEELEI